MELGTGTPLSIAAMRAGMSENTARRYRIGPLPSHRTVPRAYRTRRDPFAALWPELEALLVQAPGLEAVTIFETLRGRPDLVLADGQLRTLQRRIRRWRVVSGPEREIMFPQVHRPGEYAQSDFTDMHDLAITLDRAPFAHLFDHFVLPHSNWETGMICASESFEALVAGFQAAVWELGHVPAIHRTDHLSAATHAVQAGGRTFNARYRQVLDHYGVRPDANTPGRGHENGAVEQSQHRFKRAVAQALLLRGSRDFASQAQYAAFLRTLLVSRNRGRHAKLQEDVRLMRALPATRLEEYRSLSVLVSRFSTIRVGLNLYSVSSRLMGETVDVRLSAERIEVRYAGALMATMEREHGTGHAVIDYRHLIGSLVRKPGAFARYRYREGLFPTVIFRQAYDALVTRHGSRADVEYVRILHLAASTSEQAVEQTLMALLALGTLRDYVQVKTVVQPEAIVIPACGLPPPDLTVDRCVPHGDGRCPMKPPSPATLPLLLNALFLPTFAREYAVVAAQAAREGLTHEAYLLALATQEASERAARRVERLLVDSKLPREKSLDTFDLTRLPPKVRTSVAQLREGTFLEQATTVIVFGNPGTGKTHLVCGLGLELVRQRRLVLFAPTFQIVQRLLAAKRDLRLAAELKRLDRFEALILDDLGYVQQSREEMEVLFTLLAERYERRSIVITSNLVFSKWDQIFKDPMTTAAAVDRVVHHAVILELPIPSYRAQAAKARSHAAPVAEGA